MVGGVYLSHQIRMEVGGAKELGGLVEGDLAGGFILITAAEEQVAIVAGLCLGQFQVLHFHVIRSRRLRCGCNGSVREVLAASTDVWEVGKEFQSVELQFVLGG